MEKDINYYTFHVGEGREDYQPNNDLTWNTFLEDWNSREIKVFNIFDSLRFMNGVIKANKKYKDDFNFLKEVRTFLLSAFRSKAEYEVVITSWPTYLDIEEFEKISNDNFKYRKMVDLSISEKIDIYNQVMINWEAFKLYLLTNRKLIPKKYIS